MKGLEGKAYGEQLRSLGPFSLEETEGDLIVVLQLPHEGRAGTDFFTLLTCDRTHGNGAKLHRERFRFDIKKKVFLTLEQAPPGRTQHQA